MYINTYINWRHCYTFRFKELLTNKNISKKKHKNCIKVSRLYKMPNININNLS